MHQATPSRFANLPDTGKNSEKDPHSFSNPQQIRVRHINLELKLSFANETLHGFAELLLERLNNAARELIVDTLDLKVLKVEASETGANYFPTTFRMGEPDPILGTSLGIDLPDRATRVRIEYRTNPDALGLQWLKSEQTAGKKSPFFLTQSQTIHARSWIPLQDSPEIRVTFRAIIHCPKDLLAVMGAANNPQEQGDGHYHFEMPQPIPSYLLALAVGDLVFQPLGPRSGVYAERSVIKEAATEFSNIETMIAETERLYGPYRWDRYDLLVLPPGFPLGGMENPRLTFVTPTILAGDKSLVSVLAHELAHSWAGNLVTNATWSDFWLNEGFSVYVERRIIEKIYGRKRATLEAYLGKQRLKEEIAGLEASDQVLHASCQDPEDCVTEVPYEKGALFISLLEETFGRERFDDFLRQYFDHFAFQSITTSEFLDYLNAKLIQPNGHLKPVPLDEWIYEPGLPASDTENIPEAFVKVQAGAQSWSRGQQDLESLGTASWTVYEWVHFLKSLPMDLSSEKLQELDDAFHLTSSRNSEILYHWLLLAIRARYQPAENRLVEFLTSIGREKLIKPLFVELAKTEKGKERAKEIYLKARPGYHPLVVKKLDSLLN